MDGLRRYAAARKWRVETLEHRDCSPAALRMALAKYRPIGCAAECRHADTLLRPALFGKVPVVYFDPPDRPAWRDVCAVTCDEAAVAKMAFEELSSTNPLAYAAVSFSKTERWARERMDAFRGCCRNAGTECQTWYFPTVKSDDELRVRAEQMVPWAAALPHRCAVFAVNDWCAHCVARAMSSAGRSFPRTATLIGADGTEPLPGEKELAEMVSSARLDFELAGYLAAKTLGEKTNPVNLVNPGKNNSAAPRETLVFPPLLVDRRKSTRGYGRREPRILEAMEMIRREACDGLTAEALASGLPLAVLRARDCADPCEHGRRHPMPLRCDASPPLPAGTKPRFAGHEIGLRPNTKVSGATSVGPLSRFRAPVPHRSRAEARPARCGSPHLGVSALGGAASRRALS